LYLYDGLYINIQVVSASDNCMLPDVAFLFREVPEGLELSWLS